MLARPSPMRARYASEKITTTSYVVSLRRPGSLLPTETRSFAPPPRDRLAFYQDGGAYPRLCPTLSCETCCFNVKSLLPRLQAQVDPRRMPAPERRSLSPKLVKFFLGGSAVAISARPRTSGHFVRLNSTLPDNRVTSTRMRRERAASGCDSLRPDFPRISVLQAPRPAFPGEFEVIRPSGDRGDVAFVS